VAAVVPCFGDVPERALLERIAAEVGAVVLVDDGNQEAASAAIERVAEAVGVEVLRLPRNVGKGGAVAAGIRALRARDEPPAALIIVDADGQHPPEAIPAFVAAAANAELVVGDRTRDRRGMPWERKVANTASSVLLAAITRRRVRDSQCGMRLLRGRALSAVEFPEGRYEAETQHLKRCLRRGVSVAWVPIPAIYTGGRSSFRTVRDTLRVLAAVLARALP
jgi:glycosyltransferase involved in cell wall biosynthesis